MVGRMKAAVYARKSTEQSVADDAKSVTRQVELARAFATEKGWTVTDEHVYVDDGISGVVTSKLRGRAQMLAAAADEQFSVLIVRDVDRLGRNDEEVPSLIYTLRDAGVEVWCYADRSRVEASTALKRGMLTLRTTFAAAEREAGQERTREAMWSKAARGEVAGGRVLGYSNVRENEGGPVRRVVNEAEAAIVRRIFTLSAEGKGLLRIAKTLNAESIKNPTGQDRSKVSKRSDQWSSTGIRDVLHRDLYRGVVVYGKTRNEYRKGKRVSVNGDKTPITLECPDLRIVSDELWTAAHERMEQSRRVYLRRVGGKLVGKPESGFESQYLLSGFLRCGICGGNLAIIKRTGKRGRPRTYYACTTHHTRGDEGCINKHGVPVVELTNAVVATLDNSVLQARVLCDLRDTMAASQAADGDSMEAQRVALADRIAVLDRELKNLGDGMAALLARGHESETLIKAIETREAERAELRAKVEHLDGLAAEGTQPISLTFAEYLMTPLRRELRREPAAARQVLRRLLLGPITVTPRLTAEGIVFDFAGQATYAHVGKLETVPLGGTLDRGVKEWWPRGDSNTRHAV
jgi:site-specific DNA recombinase